MKWLRSFGRFWWDFVIGDDWRLALAGGVALALTGLLAHRGYAAWWVTPVVVVLALVATVARTTPTRSR
jgi:hypothetical protein